MSELAQDSESHELSDALGKLGQEAARLQTLIDTVRLSCGRASLMDPRNF
jgi:hypothetical protein